jgi:hypothetical protein
MALFKNLMFVLGYDCAGSALLTFRVCTCTCGDLLQNDVEMLRHKLDTQAQQLARLAQQVAGSNAASGAGPAWNAYVASGHSSNSSASGPVATNWEVSTAGAADGAAGGLASMEANAAHMLGNADAPGSAGRLALRQQQPGDLPGSNNVLERQQQDSAELQQQLLQQQLAGLELLAEAVSLLATGQAAPAGAAAAASITDRQDGNSSFSFAARGAAAAAAATAAKMEGGGLQGPAGLGPQLLRLRRLLQTGQVGRKMDWFDPVLLQKMVSSPLPATQRVSNMCAALLPAHLGRQL